MPPDGSMDIPDGSVDAPDRARNVIPGSAKIFIQGE